MIRIQYTIGGETFNHELKAGNYIIGRSKSCDIVVRDNSISGQHVRIDVDGDGATFRDLLSRNGTVLNGHKVTQGKLTSGCLLRLGHVDMQIGLDGAMPAVAATQPAVQAAAVSFPDLTDDELAPPPAPAGNYAVATVVPNSPAVQVFQLPDATFPTEDPAAASSRKRVRLLAVALVAALIGVGAIVYSKRMQKPPVQVVNHEEIYWKAINNGANEFRQDNYANALKFWKDGDETYAKNSSNPLPVGRNFSLVAQVFDDVKSRGKIDLNTDWIELRRKMLSMINDNILLPELRDFAADLELRCRREQEAKEVIRAGDDLKNRQEWDKAVRRFQDIPPSSVYYSLMNQLVAQTKQEHLSSLSDAARAAANAKNYADAIKNAEDFFQLQGKDDSLSRELARWKNQVTINRELNNMRRAANVATTEQEIQAAQQMAANIEKQFPDDARVMTEIPVIRRGLAERLFIIHLGNMYRDGQGVAFEKKLEEGKNYQSGAEVQGLTRRFRAVSASKVKADAAEARGDLDSALVQWKNILAIEQDKANRYVQYATAKLAQFTPEVIVKIMLEEAVKEHNARNYKHARELISKAKNYGGDVTEPLSALHKTGRLMFNQGVQSYNAKEFLRAFNEVNDALDCFSSEDDYFNTISTWMQRQNVERRK